MKRTGDSIYPTGEIKRISIEEKICIDRIPEELIIKIFDFITDSLSLRATSRNWLNRQQLYVINKRNNSDFVYKIPLIEIISIYRKNCAHIKVLNLSPAELIDAEKTAAISKYLPNIKHISFKFRWHGVLGELASLQHLTSLDLSNNKDNLFMTLRWAEQLTQIQKLNLASCCAVNSESFFNPIKSWTKLETLDVSHCNLMNLNFLNASVTSIKISNCTKLLKNLAEKGGETYSSVTEIDLDDNNEAWEVSILSRFPNLTALKVNNSSLPVSKSISEPHPFMTNGKLIYKDGYFSGECQGLLLTDIVGSCTFFTKDLVKTGLMKNGFFI